MGLPRRSIQQTCAFIEDTEPRRPEFLNIDISLCSTSSTRRGIANRFGRNGAIIITIAPKGNSGAIQLKADRL